MFSLELDYSKGQSNGTGTKNNSGDIGGIGSVHRCMKGGTVVGGGEWKATMGNSILGGIVGEAFYFSFKLFISNPRNKRITSFLCEGREDGLEKHALS